MKLRRSQLERSSHPKTADAATARKDEVKKFSVEDVVGPINWNDIARELNGLGIIRIKDYMELLRCVALVSPEKLQEIDIVDHAVGAARGWMKVDKRMFYDPNYASGTALHSSERSFEEYWKGQAGLRMSAAITMPEMRAEFAFSEPDFKKSLEKLQSCRGNDWRRFGNMAVALLVIHPERRTELGLDEEACVGLEGFITDKLNEKAFGDEIKVEEIHDVANFIMLFSR